MKARLFTGMILLTALFSATGCQQSATEGDLKGMVSIGTTKADLFGMPAEYRALHAALEHELGRPVRFNPQGNGAAIGHQLEQGNMNYAILTAAEYAALPDSAKVTLVAAGINGMGKSSRVAYFIARSSDNRFKSISDCADKRFAFGSYGDPLTDVAARKTLESNGVPMKKILLEVLPPPLSMEGRLYANNAASAISLDLTVNAGVIDEAMWNKLPDTGGNPLTGPSKDQFRIIGQTPPIPEMVIVAGPSADAGMTAKLKEFLLHGAKNDKKLCEQLNVTGFAEPDKAAYDSAASMISKKS